MFIIQNNDIIITKGDSGKVSLKFENRDGSEYAPSVNDEVIFSLKKRKERFSEVVLEKSGTEIVFEAEETEKIPSGEYFYDVHIKRSTGERYTAVEGKLTVRKAVHNFE